MRKYLVVMVLMLALVLVYWTVVAALSLDLFEATKFSKFRVGMSERRAEELFSSRGELLSSSEQIIGGVVMRSLTFGSMLKETLTLHFNDDQLAGFSYTNWEIGE